MCLYSLYSIYIGAYIFIFESRGDIDGGIFIYDCPFVSTYASMYVYSNASARAECDTKQI